MTMVKEKKSAVNCTFVSFYLFICTMTVGRKRSRNGSNDANRRDVVAVCSCGVTSDRPAKVI